jgi:hypothetical protein
MPDAKRGCGGGGAESGLAVARWAAWRWGPLTVRSAAVLALAGALLALGTAMVGWGIWAAAVDATAQDPPLYLLIPICVLCAIALAMLLQ